MMNRKIIALAAVSWMILFVSCEKEKPVIDAVDFESLPLDASGVWNGSDGSGGFTSGNIFFVNHYDTQSQLWRGFAYTNHDDTQTADISNQYSSITGTGAGGSEKYGVFFYLGEPDTLVFAVPEKITGIAFCNTTYSYLSMRDGTPFSKKFGGNTGNDEDWFKLKMTPIDSAGNQIGTIELYLADFRYTDNANDYIANVWTSLDLSNFGYIKEIVFEMASSDSGEWGINNPAYVCIDDIIGELAPSE